MERIVLRDVCDIIDGPHATPTKQNQDLCISELML